MRFVARDSRRQDAADDACPPAPSAAAPRGPDRRIRRLLLASLVLLVAAGPLASCASTRYNSRRIHNPAGDLATTHYARGPDGKRHRLVGLASWYGRDFNGHRTADGERYNMYAFTAAHRTLPFHTIVRVIDLKTLKSVVVRINDRGPYAPGRIIDLSYAAAHDLGLIGRGVERVRLKILRWGDGARKR